MQPKPLGSLACHQRQSQHLLTYLHKLQVFEIVVRGWCPCQCQGPPRIGWMWPAYHL